MPRRSPMLAILVGGSIAGTLDIAFAIGFAMLNGSTAMRLLQTVASGLLGDTAYDAGAPVAALGLVLHFLMSYLIAGLFHAASRRLGWLRRHAVLSGLALGVVVFLVMRLVVLPLSAFPHPVSFRPLATVADLLSHMWLFGLPISLAVRWLAPMADRRD